MMANKLSEKKPTKGRRRTRQAAAIAATLAEFGNVTLSVALEKISDPKNGAPLKWDKHRLDQVYLFVEALKEAGDTKTEACRFLAKHFSVRAKELGRGQSQYIENYFKNRGYGPNDVPPGASTEDTRLMRISRQEGKASLRLLGARLKGDLKNKIENLDDLALWNKQYHEHADEITAFQRRRESIKVAKDEDIYKDED
jgi:hypothetical protein